MGIALKAHILIPPAVLRLLSLFLQILKGEELPPRMVEYSVHHYPDSAFMAELYKMLKILIVPKPAVYQLIISGVVAVACGLKQGAYIEGSHPVLLHMCNPGFQIP